jgi:predicted  nucleic acid-binding Zn-ribbon protein
VTTEISHLLELQDLFQKKRDRARQRETLPPEFEDVDRVYRERVDAITELKRRIEEAETGRRHGEARLADLNERLKKFQAQLMEVKNSREYGAVLNEIDSVKKEIKTAEDQVVGFMETLESARQELETREAALPEETREHEAALTDWRRMQKEFDRDIEEAARRITEIEKLFPPKKLSEFYRLFERKGGHAIVRVTDGSCAACHVRLRPALYQSLRLSSDVITCDSCKRILYYEEDAAAASS